MTRTLVHRLLEARICQQAGGMADAARRYDYLPGSALQGIPVQLSRRASAHST